MIIDLRPASGLAATDAPEQRPRAMSGTGAKLTDSAFNKVSLAISLAGLALTAYSTYHMVNTQ